MKIEFLFFLRQEYGPECQPQQFKTKEPWFKSRPLTTCQESNKMKSRTFACIYFSIFNEVKIKLQKKRSTW